MIISNFVHAIRNTQAAPPPVPAGAVPVMERQTYGYRWRTATVSGQKVNPESSKKLSTAYRCGNIISDDIGCIPMQVFQRTGRNTARITPNSVLRNAAYLIEVSPNRWMTPFVFKKTIILWLLYWGNTYIWQPAGAWREWFILSADMTYPVFDEEGSLWFQTSFPNGENMVIPAVEVVHLMINSTDGINGRSVLEYARETLGGQMGAHEAKNRISGQGFNPAGIIWINGEANQEAREKTRRSYTDAIQGSANAGGVAVFDSKIAKFDAVTMKPSDAQFLESIDATDAEIANFFGMPLYKLNMGKQSYESNTQHQLDYLATTLNPFMVQWEQAAKLRWLTLLEQESMYFKFIREALLQTDAKTRAEYIEMQITSGQLTPNQACEINDLPTFTGGDSHYLPAHIGKVDETGSIQTTVQVAPPPDAGGAG